MTDSELIALFEQRDERAVDETARQYGRALHKVAFELLGSDQDAEEIVNDTLLKAWNCIPPQKPERLLAFLAAITRNLSTNRLDLFTAKRRAGNRNPALLDELGECTASAENVEQDVDSRLLSDRIRLFLDSLRDEPRAVFLLRYYYGFEIREIAKQRRIGESKVKVMLMRTRKKLRCFLEKEGFL